MAYTATGDPVFEDGFVVEDSDIRCWDELAEPLKRIVLSEAAAGNKAFNIIAWHEHTPRRICVQLYGPAKTDLSKLPPGVSLSKKVYDSQLYAIVDLATQHQLAFTDPNWKEEDFGA